jgi:glutamine amidotransferase PdxT
MYSSHTSLKTVQTIFVQQADVRLIEDLDDVTIIYTLKFHPTLSKDSRAHRWLLQYFIRIFPDEYR